MSTVTIDLCAICGTEQRSDKSHDLLETFAVCSWDVTIDGVNGLTFNDALCGPCRTAITTAIELAVQYRKATKGAK
jgi:hypothetical protein